MSLTSYSLTLAAIATVAWIGTILVILTVNPDAVGLPAVIIFIAALWIALLATVALAGIRVRHALDPEYLPSRAAAASVRDGIILATLAAAALMLNHFGLLTWGMLGLLVALAVAAFIMAKRRLGRRLPREPYS